jgi:hypothetical protein
MSTWLELNPQIQITAYIAAGPLALSLALYGIKAASILKLESVAAVEMRPSREKGYLLPTLARS